MSLKQRINDDMKRAMKAGDELRLSTLRLLNSAISNKEIELRKKDIGLSDEEISEVVLSEAKKRKDAAEGFKSGGRKDLCEKENSELKILQEYLPPEIPESDLLRIIKDGIREAGASNEKDFGKVMKIIMPLLKGKAGGDRVTKMLKEELARIPLEAAIAR